MSSSDISSSSSSSLPLYPPLSFLRGHTDSVNALTTSQIEKHLLLSGSEDASCRIWDTRTNKSIRYIAIPNKQPVTSVAFHPTKQYTCYAAAEQTIYEFDLRQQSVILKSAVREVTEATDEINQISLTSDGSQLAACDDSGEIRIFDSAHELQLLQTLTGKHTNICSSVMFRPNDTTQLLSGGMDCQICCWNCDTGKSMTSFTTNPEVTQAQMHNPPFVHTMATDGATFCSGLGSGECILYNCNSESISPITRFTGHSAPVVALSYSSLPSVIDSSSFSSPHSSSCLFTTGSDRQILLWDLEKVKLIKPMTDVINEEKEEKTKSKNSKKREKAKQKKKQQQAEPQKNERKDDQQIESNERIDSTSAPDSSLSLSSLSSSLPSTSSSSPSYLRPRFTDTDQSLYDTESIVYRWKHSAKPNAITTIQQEDSSVKLFVGDVTPHIACYIVR